MKTLLCIVALIVLAAGPSLGADMRQSTLDAQKAKALMVEKARQEKARAEKEAREARERILADRAALEQAVSDLEKQSRESAGAIGRLERQIAELESRHKDLQARVSQMDEQGRELAGNIRALARDALAVVRESPQSALAPGRADALESLAGQGAFPSMDQVRDLTGVLFDEIARSGEVRLERAPIVDRSGSEAMADVLTLGNFTAAYHLDGEAGFLLHSPSSQRFFALSRLPSAQVRRRLLAYMAGSSPETPMDITKGGALRQLTHYKSLAERLPEGGLIVWIILALGAAALLLACERAVFLIRNSVNADRLMDQVGALARKDGWEACLTLCRGLGGKPVPKVLAWGLQHKDLDRMDMENALQEVILGEIPRLEKFLSTLAMIAAVSPLLGLLGTVTGMINTFHVITYYGAGDPKMMSGGISQALITTMLGLAVAIPVMLAHTLLSRRVENLIAQMEEKAVSLANLVFGVREAA